MSAEAISALAAALAFFANAVSVLYLARQTKEAARQTGASVDQVAISNTVAAASANGMVLRSLREVHTLMIGRENMRAHFYGGRPLPETGVERDDVLTIAEMLCDVMSSATLVHEQTPGSQSAAPWADYCRHTVSTSPAIAGLLREHPEWWPALLAVLPDDFLDTSAPVPAPSTSHD